MKKTILITILSYLIYSTPFAQGNSATQKRNVIIPGFETLVINASAKVLLKESEEPFLELTGSPAFINSVKIKKYKNQISIRGNYYGSYEKGNTITIGVRKLKYLFVWGDADIVSVNTLLSPLLNILVDATATLRLAISGKTNITTGEGYSIDATE